MMERMSVLAERVSVVENSEELLTAASSTLPRKAEAKDRMFFEVPVIVGRKETGNADVTGLTVGEKALWRGVLRSW